MSENSEIASEASRLVRLWAGPREHCDSVKALIRRAARRLGFTYGRTKSLWYREARSVLAHEMDTLRRREKAVDEVFSELTALVVEAQRILHRTELDRSSNRAGRSMAHAQNSPMAPRPQRERAD